MNYLHNRDNSFIHADLKADNGFLTLQNIKIKIFLTILNNII